VFEVKFKSEETLPSRSLLPAIVKAAVALPVRPSRFSKNASRVNRGALAGGCYSYPA
jgi:hypothetical protein